MARPLLALAASLALAGCSGAQPSVLPDDSTYFSAGVTARDALDEVAADLEANGLTRTFRVDDDHFSAAAFSSARGLTALRVTSRRGTVLAMDADSEEGALLSLDPRTGTDLTGDGAADLLIVRTESERRCLALAEVDADGVFGPVPADVPWLDARLCVSRFVDLDHDARLEALVELPIDSALDLRPSIEVPLSLDARGVFVHGAWPAGFAESERQRRDAGLEVACARGDHAAAIRLAIELATIVALASDDALEVVFSSVHALPLTDEERAQLVGAAQRALELRAAARPSPSEPTSASPSASE